jgi:hypothetical protein
LRTPSPSTQRFQRVLQRQIYLCTVPSSSKTRSYRLTPGQLHAETFEAEGTRTVGGWIFTMLLAKSVSRLVGAATSAQHRLRRPVGLTTPSNAPLPTLVERKLLCHG